MCNDIFQIVPHTSKRSKQAMNTSDVRRRTDENNSVTVTVPYKVLEDKRQINFDDEPFMDDVITLLLQAEWFVGDESPECSHIMLLISMFAFDLVELLSMDIPRGGKFERTKSEREIRNAGSGLKFFKIMLYSTEMSVLLDAVDREKSLFWYA